MIRDFDNYYYNHLGTTFSVRTPTGMVLDYHSFRSWGLYPTRKPEIPTAQIKRHVVQIPGADGSIDISEYPQGYVVYSNREATWEFTVIDRKNFDAALYAVANAIHGEVCNMELDEIPGWVYEGRVAVEGMTAQRGDAIITITADLLPFLYQKTTTGEDWLWDPFNFETGIIRDYTSVAINGTTTVWLISSRAGGRPMLTAHGGNMTVNYEGATFTLQDGVETELPYNAPALPRAERQTYMTVTGNGTLKVDFRVGVL